jgi:hypothetical protein
MTLMWTEHTAQTYGHDLGWHRSLARTLQSEEIVGWHGGLIREPYISMVGERVAAFLEKSRV